MTSLQIGIRGHDYGSYRIETIHEFLDEIKADGFSNVQLVLWKLFDEIGDQLENLTPEFLAQLKTDLRQKDITISNLGSYFNVVNTNLEQREQDIIRFLNLIEVASELGFERVGTETGSINPDLSFHPQNHSEELFNEALKVIRRLVDHAKMHNVCVGIEGVEIFTIHDITSIEKMLKEINSDHLEIIFDPVNLIGLGNCNEHETLIEKAFATFGKHIKLVHFKDFKVADGELVRVPPGKGVLNYELLISKMQEFGISQGVVEEISKEESKEALRFIRRIEKTLQ